MAIVIKAKDGETYDIELADDLLKANEKIALANQRWFKAHGIAAIEIMGSVGTGKTSVIDQMVQRLKGKYRILAIAGDLGTTIDSSIIAKHGVEVMQINTGRECHLDANLVGKALAKVDPKNIDLILVENVGNLICPAEFPLGANRRVVVLSLTEGPYMVLKHPLTIMVSDVVVINKMDLSKVLDVDPEGLARDVSNVNPKAEIVRTSCKTGEGIEELIEVLGL